MDGENDHESNYTKLDIALGVQAAFEICATCAHGRGEHDDAGCNAWWKNADEDRQDCQCTGFWETRVQREDGLQVIAHEVSLTGSFAMGMNRRLGAELWDMLRGGDSITVLIATDGVWDMRADLEVVSKGFKYDAESHGLVEQRKLKVGRVYVERAEG